MQDYWGIILQKKQKEDEGVETCVFNDLILLSWVISYLTIVNNDLIKIISGSLISGHANI